MSKNKEKQEGYGKLLKEWFNNENGFDETWANMATGLLYRRLIEFLKATYIRKIGEKIKEIEAEAEGKHKKNKISSQCKNYLNKFEYYGIVLEGTIRRRLTTINRMLKEFNIIEKEFELKKENRKDISLDIYKNFRCIFASKLHHYLKELSTEIFTDALDFYKEINHNNKYQAEIDEIIIAKDIIASYEYDLIELNSENEKEYKEICISRDKKLGDTRFHLAVYSNNIFRWFNDDNKEWVKKILLQIIDGKRELVEAADRVKSSEKVNLDDFKEAAFGFYDGKTTAGNIKQFIDFITLRFVLEIMKLEFFNYVPKTRNMATPQKSYGKNIYTNLLLEHEFKIIENTINKINLFYKTNIFNEIIEIYTKSSKQFLFSPEIKENHDKNIQKLRDTIEKLLEKEIKLDNIEDRKYEELIKQRREIIKTRG